MDFEISYFLNLLAYIETNSIACIKLTASNFFILFLI